MTIAKISRKIVGVILAVVLILSVCSVSFAAVSGADAATLAALGIVDGTGANAVNSPDGSGEKVIRFTGINTRPNVEPAYNYVEGETYVIYLRYWLGSDNTGGGFHGYYGEGSAVSGKTAMGGNDVNVNNKYAGDSQWHVLKYEFTYSVPADKPQNTKVFLTFYTSGKFDIYIKDIEVFNVNDTKTDNMTGDMSHMINANGKVITLDGSDYMYGSNTAINQSYVADDGNLVFVPTTDGNSYTDSVQTGVQYLKLHNTFSDKHSEKIVLEPGHTYAVALQYKVLKTGGTNNNANLGIGWLTATNSEGDGVSGDGWYNIRVVDVLATIGTNTDGSKKLVSAITEPTEEYNTFYTTFEYTGTKAADLVLSLNSKNAEYAIGEYHVAKKVTGSADQFFVTYNDNGDITTVTAREGDPITKVGSNGYLGEECKGWCDNAQLDGELVTTVPAHDITLYAKYNTVVIDNFNMGFSTRESYDYGGTAPKFVRGQSINFETTTMGFMIPAYDDYGNNDEVDGNYAWYNFELGKKYSIVVEATDASAVKMNNLVATPATAGGSGGKRSTNGQGFIYTIATGESFESITMGNTLTWNTSSGYTKAVLRGGNENATMKMNIQRIIITEITDEPIGAITMQSIRQHNADNGYTAGIRFRARVHSETLANASEAGFVIVPKAVLNGKSVEEYMTADGNLAAKGLNYVKDEKDVVYDEIKSNMTGGNVVYKDYQVILTGLTSLTNDAVDMTGLELTAAFFVTDSTGKTTYLDEYTTSYDLIEAQMK